MSIEVGLRDHLLTLPAVRDVAGDRVFNGEATEGCSTPYAVCLRSSTASNCSMEGDAWLTQAIVDVYCYGSTYKQAKDTASAIGAGTDDGGVNGFSGHMGSFTVQGCFSGNERDPDPILSAELAALKRFGTILPLEIWYESAGNE